MIDAVPFCCESIMRIVIEHRHREIIKSLFCSARLLIMFYKANLLCDSIMLESETIKYLFRVLSFYEIQNEERIAYEESIILKPCLEIIVILVTLPFNGFIDDPCYRCKFKC